MLKTQKSFRTHIGFFGRRNAGKSSLINMLTGQETSIVSEIAGTTTDTVNKPMELQPLGPVQLIDTAGIDDEGELGAKRVRRTEKAIERADLAVLVISDNHWGAKEEDLVARFARCNTPVLVVHNKCDDVPLSPHLRALLDRKDLPVIETAASKNIGKEALRSSLIKYAPRNRDIERAIVADLIEPGDIVIMVIPIDKEAPTGRIIAPQVQTLRELLDYGVITIAVQEPELRKTIESLKQRPALVITDSQAFEQVAAATPDDVPLTGFSVLFSRYKGDLTRQLMALHAIPELHDGDRILVAEACSHHPVEDDIGRVKIPKWLRRHTGKELHFHTVSGHDFPENIADYALVIQCGSCMWNAKEVCSRLDICEEAGVPMTNYGLVIAYSLGIIERALSPFPQELALFLGREQHREIA